MSSYDSLIERMREHLPEFGGYRLAEERRASDKLARASLGHELGFSVDVLKKQLEANRKLGDSKKQVAETVIRKLNHLKDAVNEAAEHTSFLQEKEISDADSESILTLDLNLLTRSVAIKEKSIRTSREIVASSSWDREIDELYSKIKDLDESWKRRLRLASTVKT